MIELYLQGGQSQMLSDNIKNLRKSKGLSQDELATKLNVVRQTISKWENGLSVPDAEMLIIIANELDTSVNVLLDETIKPDDNSDIKVIAAKLEIINNQIAKYNETRRKMWRIIFTTVSVITICILLGSFVNFIYFQAVMNGISANTSIIGGYDGPTNIFVSNKTFKPLFLIITFTIAVISVLGIYKTRKK